MKTNLPFFNLLGIVAIFAIFSTQISAQTTSTFESFELNAGEYNNNAMGAGFNDGNVFFPNEFTQTPDFSFWTGWAISAGTDVETAGFLNEFSSITGAGVDGSSNYIVSYHYLDNYLLLQGDAIGEEMDGMYINNGTYPYLSMRDGDGFAKRFGGETGDDPDFFLLTIKAYLDGNQKPDTIDFYLADYRFDDNDMDYIVDEWTYIDLQSLGALDSLTFALTSSDTGDAGMNTPSYFCLDNIITAGTPVGTNNVIAEALSLSPNPTTDQMQLTWPYEGLAIGKLYNMQGQLMSEWTLQNGTNTLSLGDLPSAIYSLVCEGKESITVNRVVKN